MPADLSAALAQRLGVSREQVLPVCALLDSGLPPVFIAHWRKSVTGSMDEAALARLVEARRELANLEELRQRGWRVAEMAGACSDDLRRRLQEADDPESIEDLVRPLRPKRRTAGLVAQERGIGPLADYAWSPSADGPDLAVKAAEFVNPEKEVRRVDEALAGAGHILAERIADDPRVRGAARRLVFEKGILRSQQAPGGGRQAAEFRAYFKFEEPLSHLPPHRMLAVNRGERQKALKVSIEVPPEAMKERLLPVILPAEVSETVTGEDGKPAERRTAVVYRFREFLEAVAADALSRLVLPAVEREVRRKLTDRADAHAIEVFAANLRSLLMMRPVRGKRVLAIQPGFRTGCKVVALDAAGTLVGETIIYPLEPQKKTAEGKAALVAQIQRHAIDLIAIGNGTGCREVEQLVSELIAEQSLAIEYAVLGEAGASAYADSDLAKREFPNLDAAIRATVSIGRRLQDPLAEFVKIDPRAIGVGLYQHDVNQARLKRALDETMESCVAAVGADANSASPSMLRRIPGLGEPQVAALVARRRTAPLKTREELKTLAGWDERTFLLAAGFLRIEGDNPLDSTRIHPESYGAAERLLAQLGHRVEDLAAPESAQAVRRRLTGLALEPLAEQLQVPLPDMMDLVGALQQPDYDPRMQNHGPIFRQRMRQLEDLQPGMWVKGTVRNVVDFGAFVDIGLKEDGLVHISQFSRRYVRNPLKFLHVGDVVDVRIVSIEGDKRHVALTLIPEAPPKRGEPGTPGRRPPQPRSRVRAAPAGAPAGANGPPAEGAPPAGETQEAGAARPASRGRGRATRPRRPAAEARQGAEAEAAAQGAARRPGDQRRGRTPRGEHRQGDRPAAADRRPAAGPREEPGARRTERQRGPRQGRGQREHRPRSDKPRVIVSKAKAESIDRPPDQMGRPKIRWAYYDSDPVEDEFEELGEDAPPAHRPTGGADESADGAAPAAGKQPHAEPKAPGEASPVPEPPAPGAAAPGPPPPEPPGSA